MPAMPSDFTAVFSALKPIMARHARRLHVKADTPAEYTLVARTPSPFPQHKGQPMWFGSVRLGKAYVSYHLMPLYMSPELAGAISPELKKRMQGQTCFNFKAAPPAELIAELDRLTDSGLKQWAGRKWV
jgi:hypothetical protein